MSFDDHKAEYVEALVNALGAVVWEFSWETGSFTYVSQGAEKLSGHPRDEWLTPGFWMNHVHPDDRDWAAGFCHGATAEGRDHQFDYRFLRADGSFIWVRDVVTVDPVKRMNGLLRGVLLDISAEKHAEEERERTERSMHELLDGMELQAMAFEPDGTVSYVNPAAMAFRGITDPADIIGHHFSEFTPPDQVDDLDQGHKSRIAGHKDDGKVRFELVNAEGERRVLLSTRSAIPSSDGTPPRMLVVAEDVTEEIRRSDEAARAAAEFDAVFEMLRDLYFRIDRDGVVLDYKAPDDMKLAAPPERFLGRDIASVLPADVGDEAKMKVAEAFSTGKMTLQEYSLDLDGKTTRWEARFLPLGENEAAVICRDITEQTRRAAALAESELRYRTLVEIAPYGIVLLGLDLTIHYVNQAAAAMFECEAEELIGMDIRQFRACPSDAQDARVLQFLADIREGRGREAHALGIETMATMRGNLLDVERIAAVIDYQNDQNLLVIARDVTAELRADRAMKESRDFLERVLGLIDSGVLLVSGDDGRSIILANQPAERMFGYSPGGMEGLSVRDLHPVVQVSDDLAVMVDELRENETFFSEHVLQRSDGTTFDAELSVRMLGGERKDRLSVVRDISDRKAAEKLLRESEFRFRQVVNEAPFGIHMFALDEQGHLILTGANPAADELLGILHDDLIGWPIEVALPDFVDTGIPRVFERVALNGGQWVCDLHLQIGGIPHVLEVHAFQTAAMRLVVFLEDVTEKMNAADIEQRHHRRLAALATELADTQDRERRHLAEELHDRVSQALAVARMQMRAATAEPGPVDPVALEQALGLLDEAIRETRAITTELFPPVLYELGLSAALRWLCEELNRQYGLRCDVDIAELVLPVTDDTKAVLFRSARELLSNSMKYSGTNTAWLRLYEDSHEIILEVGDNGRGFDPAQQIESENGGGFGLFSIRERIGFMGGVVEVDSAPGEGARIAIHIPASC